MKVPRQPEANIGLVGHVDHGKTTLTERLTGEWTDRHSEELKRGISIRLGYADAAFYRCPDCPEPQCYSVSEKCPNCGKKGEFLRAVSFVDAPGHETLMATMLSGASLMNGALLLVAATEKCPQPQTREHMMGLEISGVENVVVVQSKIDIVTDEEAQENYEQIVEFMEETPWAGAPVVPVSAHHEVNLDYLIMEIEKTMPTPKLEGKASARMFVARSFDINRPGIPPEEIQGGVVGGSLMQGKVRTGDDLEICPGREVESSGKKEWENLTSKVTSLFSGGEHRDEAGPGGLIAIGTQLDPALTKSDALRGRVAGEAGTLPNVVNDLIMDVNLMERVVGAAEELAVEDVKTNEPLMLNVGTATTVGVVKSGRDGTAEVALKIPVCAEKGQRVAISRRIGGKWRLIGHGTIQ
jgi:translation initiation factor 2 subunit 3